MSAPSRRNLSRLLAVFTDFDGTLTTGGRLRASTYSALERLDEAGVAIVLVTGRPAGWAEAFARNFPARAVVAENGGVTFLPRKGGFRKLYGIPEADIAGWRRRMFATARQMEKKVGAKLSHDARYTEVNLAFDWNEDVKIPETQARWLEVELRRRGFSAVRSSVHVNFWPPGFDKMTACRKVAAAMWRGEALERFLYVGDALNDEPMFRGFPYAAGVANIRHVWEELRWRPGWVTRRDEGAGFEELARAILAARRR